MSDCGNPSPTISTATAALPTTLQASPSDPLAIAVDAAVESLSLEVAKSAICSPSPSHPKTAALQGLEKANILLNAGLKQGFFLPHERPFLPGLKELGFTGTNEEVLSSAFKFSPVLLSNFSSASSMWAANAATISPSKDTEDGKIHITPANLNTMFHRSIEAHFTYQQCKLIFNEASFKVHRPAISISGKVDEGAGIHLRISKSHN